MELPSIFSLCIYPGNKLTVPFSISRRISNHRAVVILIFRKIRQVDCEFYVGINIHFRLFFHSSYFIRVNYVGENPLYELMVSTVTYRDLFSIQVVQQQCACRPLDLFLSTINLFVNGIHVRRAKHVRILPFRSTLRERFTSKDFSNSEITSFFRGTVAGVVDRKNNTLFEL